MRNKSELAANILSKLDVEIEKYKYAPDYKAMLIKQRENIERDFKEWGWLNEGYQQTNSYRRVNNSIFN